MIRFPNLLPRVAIAAALVALSATALSSTAAATSRPLDVSHYRIKVRVTPEGAYQAQTTITLALTSAASHVDLDASEFTIDSVGLAQARPPARNAVVGVKIGDATRPLRFVHRPAKPPGKEANILDIDLGRTVAAGEKLTLKVRYHGQAGTEQNGFFRSVVPGEPNRLPLLFTMFEPEGARRFFPCNDDPADKATTEIVAEVDPRYTVLSNGGLVKDETFVVTGSRGAVTWRRVHWRQDKPHSTYLVALAIGQFETLRERVQLPATAGVPRNPPVPVALHVSPGNGAKARFALDATADALRFFEKYLEVPFPWAKYDQVALPTFTWGGMENTSLTTQLEPGLVLDEPGAQLSRMRIVGLVAHELAHQWFGDLVTMRGWEDVWLNESFASYMESLFSAAHFANEATLLGTVYDTWESYFRTEDGPRSHPIVQRELPTPDDAFDAISYTKGEHVLRMLAAYVGQEPFRIGVRNYLRKYGLKNATNVEFFAEVAQAAGKDLEPFRKAWLLARGYPVLTAREKYDAKAKTVTLTITQRPNHKSETTVFVAPLEVVVSRRDAPAFEQVVPVQITQKTTEVVVKVSAEPQWVNWNLRGTMLTDVETPTRAPAALELQALYDKDPVARLRAQIDLAEPILGIVRQKGPLARRGAVWRRLAFGVLSRALCQDPSPYVRERVLDKLLTAHTATLPTELGAAIMANTGEVACRAPDAPAPQADIIGAAQLRAKALEAAGLVGSTKGLPTVRPMLKALLSRADLPVDLLGAAAAGMARIGDNAALVDLRAAKALHGKRGYPYQLAIGAALSRVRNPQVAVDLRAAMTEAGPNGAMVRRLLSGLADNLALISSSEGIAMLTDWVLAPGPLGEEQRSRILQLFEEQKSRQVKAALDEIAKKSGSERLRALALRTLKKNYR